MIWAFLVGAQFHFRAHYPAQRELQPINEPMEVIRARL